MATVQSHPRLDRRTRAARAERRDSGELFLSAAEKLFAERGYTATTIGGIAAEAGFSKGALYRHFASKEELFLALLEERIDRPVRDVIELVESAPSDRNMAPEASRIFFELLRQERELVLLSHEFWSLAVRDPRLRALYAKRDTALRSALAKALRRRAENLGAPEFSMPAEEAATAFMAIADGLSLAKLIDSEAVPDRLYGDVLSLIYEGLVARAKRDGPRSTAG